MNEQKLKPLTERETKRIEGGNPALIIAGLALGVGIGNTMDRYGWLAHKQTYRYGGRLNLQSAH